MKVGLLAMGRGMVNAGIATLAILGSVTCYGAVDSPRVPTAAKMDDVRDLDWHLVWGKDGADRGYVTAVYFDRDARVGVLAFANADREDQLLGGRLNALDMELLDWFK